MARPLGHKAADGNRLEIYTDMMRVPNGEEFPRKEYANALQEYANNRA
jgi:uncharacterized protein YjlB